MPHTFTAPERTAVAGTSVRQYAKLEIQDESLSWVDVSSIEDIDWFNSASVSDDIDNNTVSFQATLLRDTASLSLVPNMGASSLNDGGPMLDLVRQWRLSVSVVGIGGTPDYKEIAKGYVGTIDVDDAAATIQVTGRGEEAPLLDCEILEIRTYSMSDSMSMEDVIQALLDDNLDDPPTLNVPVASDFIINEYEQDYGNLMQAIQAVAALTGGIVRYRYDTDGVNKLTLYFPNRDAEPGDEDWTIGPTEYLALPVNSTDIDGVRNFVPVRYNDADTLAVETVTSPEGGMSPSIARYKRRSLPIDLGEDTQILTATQAQALADAIRHDLEWPYLRQRFVTYGFWFVQLCDYGKLLANGVHYDEDQYGGVTGFTHEMANGVIRTSVDLGGPPIGGYLRWIPIARRRRLRVPTEGPIGDPILPPLLPPPPPAPGELAAEIAGDVKVRVTPSAIEITEGTAYLPSIPPTCTSALSGLAIDDDFQFTLCEVATDQDIKDLSSQYTTSAAKLQSAYVAGKKFTHVFGVEVVDDATSANGVRHARLYAPPGDDDGGYTYPTNTKTQLKMVFPVDIGQYTNFWCRVFMRNMIPGDVSSPGGRSIMLKTQDRSNTLDSSNGFEVARNDTDNLLKLYLEGLSATGAGDITSVAVSDSDMVEVMFHVVLTNPTSALSSKVIRWDCAADIYVRINGTGTVHARSASLQVDQPRFSEATSGPLAPWQLAFPEAYTSSVLSGEAPEIHGIEFVENSTSSDPFGVI